MAYLLNALGYKIRCLVRPRSDRSHLPSGAEIVQGHILDFNSLKSSMKGCRAVIHIAGVVKVKQERDFFLINRDGVANVAKAASESGVERFLLCSSLAAAGPPLDETPRKPDDPPHPITVYGKSKLQGEEALKNCAENMWWGIIRPPAVYGPSDTSFLPLIKSIKRGFALKLGQGSKFSLIYAGDLARSMLLLLEINHSSGSIWYATDGYVHTDDELTNTISSILKTNPKKITIPIPIIKSLGALNQTIAGMTGKTAFFGKDKVRELTCPIYTCDDTTLREETGYREQWDLFDGMTQTINWYKSQGWL